MSDFHHAQLDWDDQGQPQSSQFGDVYFSRASGLEETRYVFLSNNRLTERFTALAEHAQFSIGETGFGTGLNFLCAWQLFEQTAPATARLQFVSVEKYPLTLTDLERALALWPELEPYSRQLLDQYRAIHPGFQHLSFAGGRVQLTLLVGDVLEQLPQLDARLDAWFLDGFAPAKNPQMWTPALFAQLARLAGPDCSLATFTCAGFVRRGLIEVGFQMRKVPGFGHKREMLQGERPGSPAQPAAPWYARPPRPRGPRQAIVIGGGLAGCSSAASLAQRGWQVRLIERHPTLAAEASGNPQGVLYLKLSAHGTALSQLVVAGYGRTRRLLEQPALAGHWQACGVLQLAQSEQERQRQRELAETFPADLLRPVDAEQASTLAGTSLSGPGLFFPEAGWAHPPALCHTQADHPAIELLLHEQALELRQSEQGWQVWSDERCLAEAPVVILANAGDLPRLPQTAHLPLKQIRGQITRLPVTPASAALRTVVCAEGYVAPAWQGEHTLGASFNFQRLDSEPSAEEHRSNLQLLAEISPALAQALEHEQLDPAALQGRAALRCTTPDYLPLVGPVADAAEFNDAFAELRKDARRQPDTPCPWLDGLYVNAGHGSRGLITAPLAAELLAAWLEDEPLPLPLAVAEACHPNRFLLRKLIRGQ